MKNVTAICAHPWAYAAHQPGYDITPILGDIFRDFKAAGLDGIELMHNVLLSEQTVSFIEELSRGQQLPVVGTSFGGNMWDAAQHDAILKQAETVVRALERLGGKTLGVSTGGAPEGKKTDEQLDTQCRLLRRMIDLAADHGVTLNLHNHTYEALYGEHEINENIKRLPDVKLGPDLNWLRRAGVNAQDFLRRHRDRMAFMHLRDQKGDRWVEALGDGDEDYVALGRVLDEINFTGPVAIELAHEADTQFTRTMGENFAVSCRNLRKAWGM
jgi:sugar phosphate isomerase/epimerase